MTWLSREAAALGVDAERIAVAGDSAGAGLAAVALHETKGQLAAPVRGQALIYPALDLRGRLPSRTELAEQFPIPHDMIQWFFGHYFGAAWPCADPRANSRPSAAMSVLIVRSPIAKLLRRFNGGRSDLSSCCQFVCA